MRSLTPQAPEAFRFRFAWQESETNLKDRDEKAGPLLAIPRTRPGVIASVGVTRYTVTRYDSGEVQWQRQNE